MIRVLVFAFLIASSSFAAEKYKRALVIHGTKTNVGFLFGLVKKLQEREDTRIDVIVANTGAVLPAAIVHYYAEAFNVDPENFELPEYVTSEEGLYALLNLAKMLNKDKITKSKKEFPVSLLDPNKQMIEFPEAAWEGSEVWDSSFRTDSPIDLVVGTSKLAFDENGQNGEKKRKKGERNAWEMYWSNDRALSLIERHFGDSGNHELANSLVNGGFITSTGTLGSVTRKGIADPTVLVAHEGCISGVCNLHALDVGQAIAEEVIYWFPGGATGAEEDRLLKVIGYRDSLRRVEMADRCLKEETRPVLIVDGTNMGGLYDRAEMSYEASVGFKGVTFNLVLGTHEQYLEKLEIQMQASAELVNEALAAREIDPGFIGHLDFVKTGSGQKSPLASEQHSGLIFVGNMITDRENASDDFFEAWAEQRGEWLKVVAMDEEHDEWVAFLSKKERKMLPGIREAVEAEAAEKAEKEAEDGEGDGE